METDLSQTWNGIPMGIWAQVLYFTDATTEIACCTTYAWNLGDTTRDSFVPRDSFVFI